MAEQILPLVGGASNVANTANCMTRLRLTLRDDALADIPGLKKVQGVLGVVEDQTLQII